jgi:serine/threonine protein kinase/formylglycine-generating enzyme required for sulfatase activity
MTARPDPHEESELFGAVVGLSPEERRRYLDEHCPDPQLRQRLEYLLAAHDVRHHESFPDPGGPFTTPPPDGDSAPDTAFPPESECAPLPAHIGRYLVVRILGKGSFGIVFLAKDERLNRDVAIKVPRREIATRPEVVELYLAEARTVANLDHPNIVPVYDSASSEDYPCFIVSKFIEGTTLARKIAEGRPSWAEAAGLVATVAQALAYAHEQGVYHRDVKPGNILLDGGGIPYVADFGLALREEDVGRGPEWAGTPAYMSPEQACGEGHRVNGQSDIFSLGVVFYELLTGRRPFPANSRAELLDQILKQEVCPPRQWSPTIPKELERICLRALSKRATDRYTMAGDMAEELRHFHEQATGAENTGLRSPIPAASSPASTPASTPVPGPVPAPPSDHEAVKIVPKGLRSFDAYDADFFLELLPGPRDRGGLPDSIRFWKTRIEETDPDNTAAVGLLYGPSGCGKSSLVKAGLLPRLAGQVVTVYVEATAEETEARLLKALRKHCPRVSAEEGLANALFDLRRGHGLAPGKKVLLVLDQFEQWLHARRVEENTDLVKALRQCDGGRVQGLVMVRDDFWMAATRFMQALEVRLVEGHNAAAVDLFDPRHARKVLAAFGRAFAALPERPGDLGREQEAFLDQAVGGLARDGKVIPVRLALFAEMVKGKPWTPATLKAVGGTEGIGVAFLEETFSAATAPPQHRLHQKAARRVLKLLLPDQGADIRGHMRSHQDLQAASGYAHRPADFAELLRILDREVRLVTPTDPEGIPDDETGPARETTAGGPSYQLTHDYLVPTLRQWLTRKQRETYRGRAELRLAERATTWAVKPESRHLPAWWEWLTIRLLTRKKNWTPTQRKMMGVATRFYAVRGVVAALVLAGAAILAMGLERQQADYTARQVDQLITSEIDQVPKIVEELRPHRRWLDAKLVEIIRDPRRGESERLRARLALLPRDPGQIDYLFGRLLAADPDEFLVVRDALSTHREQLAERLWAVLQDPNADDARRLRAAAALAAYDPDNVAWPKLYKTISIILCDENPVYRKKWAEALRPLREKLTGELAKLARDQGFPKRETELPYLVATRLLTDSADDRPEVLTDLLLDADAKAYALVFPLLEQHREPAVRLLSAELDRVAPDNWPDEEKERLAKRQANAAVTLVRLGGGENVWRLLRRTPWDDPRTRSYLIHRLAPLGTDRSALIKRLDEENKGRPALGASTVAVLGSPSGQGPLLAASALFPGRPGNDVSILRALLLSLGEFGPGQVPQVERDRLIPVALDLYRTDPDPGLHGAADWLLRQWDQQDALQKIDQEWENDAGKRKQRENKIKQELASGERRDDGYWYVNGQGQTMVVIPGPVKFRMGSPSAEQGREGGPKGNVEQQEEVKIEHSFAIASREVTLQHYRKFYNDFFKRDFTAYYPEYSPTQDCPVHRVTWYEAAAYCNWLSKQEGITDDQLCYLPNEKGEFKEGMKLAPDWQKRAGYRLPTEAEWEYACRAKAVTSRPYGETEELLGKYVWYTKNSLDRAMLPGKRGELGVRGDCLKPNDFGLFNMLGNVDEWCHDPVTPGAPGEDLDHFEYLDDTIFIQNDKRRAQRGGGFMTQAPELRSAARSRNNPFQRNSDVGFRPAKLFR